MKDYFIMNNFAIEEIGKAQKLYYRIHIVNIDNNIDDPQKKIKPVAFDPQPKTQGSVKMSVNWEKYSTPDSTQKSARNPDKNGVVSFISHVVRSSPVNLNLTHAPTSNRAHSHIHDVLPIETDPEIRLKLRAITKWEIEI